MQKGVLGEREDCRKVQAELLLLSGEDLSTPANALWALDPY